MIFHASNYVPTPCLGFRSSRVFSFALSYIYIYTHIFLLERRKNNGAFRIIRIRLSLIFHPYLPRSPLLLLPFSQTFDRATGVSYPSLESVSVEFTRVANPALVFEKPAKSGLG